MTTEQPGEETVREYLTNALLGTGVSPQSAQSILALTMQTINRQTDEFHLDLEAQMSSLDLMQNFFVLNLVGGWHEAALLQAKKGNMPPENNQ